MKEQNPIDTPKIQLSLCMIVKNEEKNLGSCLDSIKDIVDEMIILDTGSSDNTVQIAKLSNKRKLRSISFDKNNSLLFHRKIKKGNSPWKLSPCAENNFLQIKFCEPNPKKLLRFNC